MKTEPTTPPDELGAVSCSALEAALALVDFGACRDGDPAEWINVASPMCAHCIGSEDVNLAAARIIQGQLREVVEAAESLLTYVTAWHRSAKQDAAVQRWEKAISSLPNDQVELPPNG